MRKSLAGLSACGIGISVAAYVRGLVWGGSDDQLWWVIALAAGAVAITIPMVFLETPSIRARTFLWKEFAKGMPNWVVPAIKLLWIAILAHFVWFFVVAHGGVPVVKDDQFILSSRGRIVKVLTEKEYLVLRADELRVLAALMLVCYFMPMMYWWFPRNRQEHGSSA